MDRNVAVMAQYAAALRFSDLPDSVVHQCKRCIVDTWGCAVGGYPATPSRVARELAQRADARSGARLIGTNHRTLPELAAFANGVAVRYLDANDCLPGGGGHPSDSVPAIFAMADATGSTGRAVITATALVYELYDNLRKAVPIFTKGVDSVFYTSITAAAGAAKVLALDSAQMAEAISLSITPNVPLDATRYGALATWKGCAGANAARNGVFAALLAAAGITGPDKPIEGEHGIENLLGKFEQLPLGGDGQPFGIAQITQKAHAAVSAALPAIPLALELARETSADDIETVTLYTYWQAWEINGREPEKWRPMTREAADHSVPYIVAAVLAHGEFGEHIFSDEALRDARVRALIDKVAIKPDEELTRKFPDCMPCRIEIVTKRGERKIAQADYPRGHHRNPMSDEEIGAKFRSLARSTMPKDQIDAAIAALWELESASSLNRFFDALTIDP